IPKAPCEVVNLTMTNDRLAGRTAQPIKITDHLLEALVVHQAPSLDDDADPIGEGAQAVPRERLVGHAEHAATKSLEHRASLRPQVPLDDGEDLGREGLFDCLCIHRESIFTRTLMAVRGSTIFADELYF